MDRGDDGGEVVGRRLDEAAVPHDAEAGAQQRLRRHRTHQHEHAWRDLLDLGAEPRPARDHVRARRAVVEAPLAARLPAEVLDGVGEVDGIALDAGQLERRVEHVTRWSDEGMARHVLAIAGLLTDEHERRAGRTLTEDRLRRRRPELAAATARRRLPQLREPTVLRDEWCRSLRLATSAHPFV